MEKHGKGDLPAPARVQLRALIEALPDVLTGLKLEETVDGLQIEIAGMGGLALGAWCWASAARRRTET